MKPRGRPRLVPDDTTVQTSIRLPSKQFDATQRDAADARMTMAEWIRLKLTHVISHTKNRP
jgi:hypothetical protein